ncbi:MAG: DotU family type IV/VI secretion system protein, partial [Hyphomicrobiales bacterium]|nr:DotU family type IV/VI secretion system protein [Hyphomicrobiales bacterium]
MTNDDPFGRSDRTIIRPNPAGRLTPPGSPAAQVPPPGGARPASTPTPPVSYPAPPYSAPPHPPPQRPAPAPGQGDWDAWMKPPAQSLYAPPSAALPMTPAPSSPHVSADLITADPNPLTRAAASLLLLLGRLRASLARAGASQLMDQVAQAIQQFEIDAIAGGAAREQVEIAKYALAACADDIVQNLPAEDSRVWTQYSMLVR